MTGLHLLIPEYLLLAGAIAALFIERVSGREGAGAALGAVVALAAAIAAVVIGAQGAIAGGMLALDAVAVTVRVAIAALTAVYLLWLVGRGMGPERSREAVAFVLFAALGSMLMASARDLIVLFISLELATMPAYVLMGYRRNDERNLEGALKYFLLSMTTSLILLYGLSFLFGIAGSTSLVAIAAAPPAGLLGTFASVFVFIGLFAKMSAAPFHFWAPDAYAGAPAGSVAFVSTVPKLAGTAVMVNLATALVPHAPVLPAVLALAAVTSMLLGNLAAFPQTDIRRLMAYSGVAHTGYVLLALSSATPAGYAAAVFYTIAYVVPSMAITLIAAEEGTALDDLAGLVVRRPAVAWGSVVLLLSLVGVPPMAGMLGKLFAFTAAVSAGRLALVIVAVVMSVVSAGYYFRILRPIFFASRSDAPVLASSRSAAVAFSLLVAATLALGIAASPLLSYLGVRFF
ncbi:MAG: NADH-quinone oxidoreductase subunit [Actinobacteria bacterium]|nr:MAG: NADH-quinone oxidoreductase subunit [Actinomycetota bacterium]